MNKSKKYTSNILDNILNLTTEKEAEKVKYRMLLAEKIDKALKAKGMKKKDLAEATGKSRSTITQWLSGTHNFTSDTLYIIGKILNIDLLNYEEKKEKEQVEIIHVSISSDISTEPEYKENNWFDTDNNTVTYAASL